MPKPWIPMSVAEFGRRLRAFDWRRRITAVHMHHTFIPDHAAWRSANDRGAPIDTIEGMYRYHTDPENIVDGVNKGGRGWSDIAQHVSIAPDGLVWSGRDWNRSPASAVGHNGSDEAGPFMFEMIGNFDRGGDTFRDPQRAAALDVTAIVLRHFRLPPEALKFHRDLLLPDGRVPKTCPGTAIAYDETIADLRLRLAA